MIPFHALSWPLIFIQIPISLIETSLYIPCVNALEMHTKHSECIDLKLEFPIFSLIELSVEQAGFGHKAQLPVLKGFYQSQI